MALTVVRVFAANTTYTIAAGKMAKVIVSAIAHSNSGYILIGDYIWRCTFTGSTEYTSEDTLPVGGDYLVSKINNSTTTGIFLRTHYLVAGQTITTSSATNKLYCTVFLEDT